MPLHKEAGVNYKRGQTTENQSAGALYVMGCKSHHAMLDPYCGGTTCTRAAGSVLLRAKLTRGQQSEFLVRCGSLVVG